jgi:hypothetical protein
VFNAHAYAFCDTPLNYAMARSDCAVKSMRLARIDDLAEDSWVHTMIPAADQASNNVSVWRGLGGNDLVTAGDWRWDDGQAFWSGGSSGVAVNGLYTHWANGAPTGSALQCLAMEARAGTWHNQDCAGARPYVCEQY